MDHESEYINNLIKQLNGLIAYYANQQAVMFGALVGQLDKKEAIQKWNQNTASYNKRYAGGEEHAK